MTKKPFDRSLLIGTFKAESEDHLAQLSKGLLSLEKNPDQPAIIQALFRSAHTLKGAARMMGFLPIQNVAHSLEDLFGMIQQGKMPYGPAIANQALAGLDVIKQMLNELAQGKQITTHSLDVCQAIQACLKGLPAPKIETKEKPVKPADSEIVDPLSEKVHTSATAEEFIRVPIDRVSTLLNLVGEVVINKVKASYKLGALRRLTQQAKKSQKRLARTIDDVKVVLGKNPGSSNGLADALHQCNLDAERLRQELNQFSDRLSSETTQLDPIIDELQFKVKELRMLPCATIFEGFERLVRDIAQDEKKKIELIIEGSETELDKKVLEATKPCLIHILRNAVSHGIESQDERKAAKKSGVGEVKLTAAQHGGKVIISVEDDGRGIDLDRVKEIALKKKIVGQDEIHRMDDDQVLNLIFSPGFTTTSIITDVSGRGVGLDAVLTEVQRLKGQIRVTSQKGKGTLAIIELPLTVAVLQILLVETEGFKFGLPLSLVEKIATVSFDDLQTIENRMAMTLRDQTVPIVNLSDVLDLPKKLVDEDAVQTKKLEEWPVAIASSLERRVGFMVERIVGEDEIFIKSLGTHLTKIKNVSGATILGTGEVIVILDVADLILSSRMAHPAVRHKEMHMQKPKRKILVVEDSLTTREMERNILQTQGYIVETAVDGIDALEKLGQDTFHLIICDVEMPRMSGFEFCKTLRQRAEYNEIPFIFLTSLSKEEEKRRGVEAGAQAYIIKTSFDQTNLLQTIERLIG